jgi:hypothetical protein
MHVVDAFIRTSTIAFELFRAYIGTPGQHIQASIENKASKFPYSQAATIEDYQQENTEWDCQLTTTSGQLIPNATICLTKQDQRGDMVLEASHKTPDDLTGPSFAFTRIAGTEVDGKGVGMLTITPTPNTNRDGDQVCATKENALIRKNDFTLFPGSTSGPLSDECFEAFDKSKLVKLPGQDGQLHNVNISPPGGGETGLFDYVIGPKPHLPRIQSTDQRPISLSLFVHVSQLLDAQEAGNRSRHLRHRSTIRNASPPAGTCL